jgi:hypothetical protein
MVKKILAFVAATMLATGVSFAAPITTVHNGQTVAGYDHYDMSHNVNDDSFYVEHGLSSNVAIGAERNTYSIDGYSTNMTDVYARYKLNSNVSLIAGNRSYNDNEPNRFVYGINGNVNLGGNVDAYANLKATNMSTEWETGLAYKLAPQTTVHLGYKSYSQDNSSTVDGIGYGVSFAF